MTLSDLSIKRPVFAWMIMAALISFGAISFSRMGISQLPDVDYPVVSVSVSLEGAAPEVMETQVTDVLEGAVMTIAGIRDISSVSRRGSARITLEFELEHDIDDAMQEVQAKVSQAQRRLPRDIDPPIVTKTNPEDQPIIWIALSGDRPLTDLMNYTNDVLRDQLSIIEGVGDVTMGGYTDPALRVWLDADKMDAAQLTVTDIMNAITAQHSEQPAGYIDTGKKEFNVRVLGEAPTPEAFSRMVIQARGGAAIWRTYRIGDVATVEDGLDDVRRIARNWGQRAVGLGVRKQRGANAVATARLVKEKIELIKKDLPAGMRLEIVNDATRFIEESTHELNFTLFLSALLTGVACWLFLGSWSSTLNVLLAIPTSIVGAFIVLYFMGFTLNVFTLLGLTLAIGIVVDDAIMMLENIVRHNEKGEGRVRAAIVGAREMTFPAMAASIAILAIFIPVIFMEGIIGKFFFQFGVTMTAAVMLSLLEALTLTPMRCSQFVTAERTLWIGRAIDALMEKARRGYASLLSRLLARRWTVLGAAALVFAASLSLVNSIPKEFSPAQDQSRFLVRVQMPVGTAMGVTSGAMETAEKWAMAQPNIRTFMAITGGFGGGQVNQGMMMVALKPPAERVPLPGESAPPTQQEFMRYARKPLSAIPGVRRVAIQDPSLGGFTAQRGFPIEFSLRGKDWEKLAEYSERIMEGMKNSGKMNDIDTDYQEGMPEVRVVPDREKAAARGVSVASIGDAVNAMIGGVRSGKFTRAGRRYDVRVQLLDKDRRAAGDIRKIWVRNNRGEVIRLSEVVNIVEKPTLLSISRKNRERAIGVFANVAEGASQEEAIKEVERLARGILPEGYKIVFSGTSKTFQDSFRSLNFALILGVIVAYMILASQFNSFVHPVTVLLALPFSVTGAFIALKLGGYSLSIYSMIGIILLMGIVKKNSILLVDFTNHRRRDGGLGVNEALLEACPIRLRPILMTSFATIAAAIPPALGYGPGAETRIPMALVVIGGVFFSTMLTLLVVPCAYSLMSNLESRRHEQALKSALRELGEAGEDGKN
ncbi:MAG: efflux RND transporter permease subunit [Elusimicrobiales bacterium]|nr:efflux RND transporter permease subunit [Elusimicrobiales bacterium]